MTIIEKKILLAEFMGATHHVDKGTIQIWKFPDGMTYHLSTLNYDTSMDALWPVLQKISSLEGATLVINSSGTWSWQIIINFCLMAFVEGNEPHNIFELCASFVERYIKEGKPITIPSSGSVAAEELTLTDLTSHLE